MLANFQPNVEPNMLGVSIHDRTSHRVCWDDLICAMDLESVTSLCAGVICLNRKKKRKPPRLWAKKWLLERNSFSHMSLLTEIATNEPQDYRNYLRMNEQSFEDLLERVYNLLEKKNTKLRESISVKERLVATLQFLASSRSYENLKFSCAISAQTLGRIVPETCTAIFDVLRDDFLKFPCNASDWMNIAEDFKTYWQVENCVGAIDGRHIDIRQPPGSGSYFFNYKGFYSIVLLAVVNANYEFIYVNCGTNGRVSDGGVLMETDFGELLENKKLNLPSPTNFPDNRDICLPFTFLGDEAFPLKENLMKPYPNKGITHDEKFSIIGCVVEDEWWRMRLAYLPTSLEFFRQQ
ncbi:putative nuclease HARBI1 isoform X2 [Onthophagus taurus]|uniref:putative nuclease HARBI1 isoform X2 n=1 Tax=Onthophagus taurus TaxID=166361 RepID=UPI0039BE5867